MDSNDCCNSVYNMPSLHNDNKRGSNDAIRNNPALKTPSVRNTMRKRMTKTTCYAERTSTITTGSLITLVA